MRYQLNMPLVLTRYIDFVVVSRRCRRAGRSGAPFPVELLALCSKLGSSRGLTRDV